MSPEEATEVIMAMFSAMPLGQHPRPGEVRYKIEMCVHEAEQVAYRVGAEAMRRLLIVKSVSDGPLSGVEIEDAPLPDAPEPIPARPDTD